MNKYIVGCALDASNTGRTLDIVFETLEAAKAYIVKENDRVNPRSDSDKWWRWWIARVVLEVESEIVVKRELSTREVAL